MKINRRFNAEANRITWTTRFTWLRRGFCALGVSSVLAAPSYAQASACDQILGDIVGVALDAKTGELLYCEQHKQIDALNWRVEYSVNGQVIAEKTLDYSRAEISPQVKQSDYRTGELREVTEHADQWLVSYRPDRDARTQTKALSQEGVQVIDAGFDFFVRQQWRQLAAGETVVFDFISVPHLKAIALRAKKVSMDNCKSFAVSAEINTPQCISVEANSGLLRLFVDRLVLLYDEQQRLRGFKGAVNIQNSAQDTQDAIIYYRYPSRPDEGTE
ncbi:MAG TPA: hypothetical protein VIC26_12860 [Marinagarivorans sp.]